MSVDDHVHEVYCTEVTFADKLTQYYGEQPIKMGFVLPYWDKNQSVEKFNQFSEAKINSSLTSVRKKR